MYNWRRFLSSVGASPRFSRFEMTLKNGDRHLELWINSGVFSFQTEPVPVFQFVFRIEGHEHYRRLAVPLLDSVRVLSVFLGYCGGILRKTTM